MEELLKHVGEDVTVSVADDAKGAHGKLVAVDDVGIFMLAAMGNAVDQWEVPKFYPWDNIISVTVLRATGNP
jgi:hypothetical protein